MLLQGLFVPLTCPFYRDGQSYLRKLEHNVRRYSLGPAAGLIALPPNGEAGALTDAEAEETLRSVAEVAAKEKVLLAGVKKSSVHAALSLAAAAEKAGFDAIVLAPPPEWPRFVRGEDARELLLFFQSVADASPLPVVLWSDAAAPSLQLPVIAVADLAKHANIIGLIDADLTPERLAAVLEQTRTVRREVTVTTIFEAVTRRMLAPTLEPSSGSHAFITVESLGGGSAIGTLPPPTVPALKTRSKAVGFQVLSAGPAHAMPPLLQAGATGAMPVLAACAPQGCFEAYAAWKDGDAALSEERAARLKAMDELLDELGMAALKYGCDWNGYYGGNPRPPRLPLTAEQRTRVEFALGEVRN